MSKLSRQVELNVSGMTCTSCSGRVERKLNKLDGVEAAVNFATETATVSFDERRSDLDLLIGTIRGAGYDAEPADTDAESTGADEEDSGLLRRLWVSALLTLPVVVLSMVPALQFPYWQWIVLALASPVFFYGGAPFHRACWRNLRHGSFTMDTLVSLGTSAAFAWSLWALIFGNAGAPGMTMSMHLLPMDSSLDEIYLETASVVTTFLLLGRWFEHRAKGRSSQALRSLLELAPTEVTVLRGDAEVRIPARSLSAGEVFLVRPGEKIAADGLVVAGSSEVDESLLTGESLPIDKFPDSSVIGGSLNGSGRLTVRATRTGQSTTLAQMSQLVTEAQQRRAPVQRLVDRVSQVFVPIVIALSLATWGVHYWVLGAGLAPALTAAIAVLIIACPCALGLATPTAMLVGSGRGAQLGLLIRGPEALESSRRISAVLLDKTGTVTTGQMTVAAVYPAAEFSEQEILQGAAAVEAGSNHPIAQAIVRAVQDVAAVEDFRNIAGQGVSGTVAGRHITVGRPHVDLIADAVETTAVEVRIDDAHAGLIALRDRIHDSSAAAIDSLRQLGLDPWLVTGDNRRVALAVAAAVGIAEDHVLAELTPAGKVEVVEKLEHEGVYAAMAGDGINDAAALARAELGLSMGAGTDVAIEASDITLMRSDLPAAVDAIRLSRRTLHIIRGNLFWAFAYNVVLLPVAAAGLLNPMLAGIAMAFSSVFVVSNSLRLRRFQPSTINGPPGDDN